jgi:hypothetical protein
MLLERGRTVAAVAYALGSVLLSVGGLIAALMLIKKLAE